MADLGAQRGRAADQASESQAGRDAVDAELSEPAELSEHAEVPGAADDTEAATTERAAVHAHEALSTEPACAAGGDEATAVIVPLGEQRTEVTPTVAPNRLITELPSGAEIARWTGRTGTSPPPDQMPTVPLLPQPSPIPVPPPRKSVPATDEGVSQERDRTWALNVAAASAALVLFAVIGVGLWLILRTMRPTSSAPPIPVPSSSVSASVESSPSEVVPSPAPTSRVQTQPTVITVAIPDVGGIDQASAAALLTSLGLRVTVTYRETASVAGGVVINSVPGAGRMVPPGTTVTLVVARTPSPPALPTVASSPAPPLPPHPSPTVSASDT